MRTSRADDRRGIRAEGVERGVQHRLPAVGIAEQHGRLPVHPGGGFRRDRVDGTRHAEQVDGKRYRVDAEVEQGAAAEFGRVEPVGRVAGEQLVVVGDQRAHLAEGSGGDDLADAQHVRQEPRPHRLEHHEVFAGGQFHHGAGLGGVQREGLLHQGVLSGVQRELSVGGMERVRRGHVDRIDLRVRHEVLVAAVRGADSEFGGECLGGR